MLGVDVSGVLDLKLAMTAEHASQLAWVARHHGIADYVADVERFTRRVGKDFGVPAAEGLPPIPPRALSAGGGAAGVAGRGGDPDACSRSRSDVIL